MSDDEETVLHVEDQDFVRILTIDRPHRRNAISTRLREELTEQFLRSRGDKNVRAIVLTATGSQAFSAGVDLKEISDRGPDAYRGPLDQGHKLLYEIVMETYKPTIAALNGAAVGGGCELALACDLRIAAQNARFALPEAKIGMGAVFGSVVLPRRLPLAVALKMLYTGDFMDAEEALRWGLVNEVVETPQLMPTALALAHRIAANAPITVRRMKHMAIKGLELPPPAAMRLDVGPDPYTSNDRVEGIAAFLDGRKPQWTDS
jgi:enoyl-CoA hydratase